MTTLTKGGFCSTCNQQRMGSKQVLGDGWGCLLTIITAGLFLIVWLPLKFFVEYPKPYLCNVCGKPLKYPLAKTPPPDEAGGAKQAQQWL